MSLTVDPTIFPPWDFVGADVLPDESGPPLRAESFRLGLWVSPQRFPWDVSLVRTRWFQSPWPSESDPAGGVPPRVSEPEELTVFGSASLLLVPRPWPVPRGDIVAEYEAWRQPNRRHVERPGWKPTARGPIWRRVEDPPKSLAEVWESTAGEVEAAGASVPAEGQSRAAHLKRLWEATPWMFALSPELLRVVVLELELPGSLDGSSILLAARGARRSHGWLAGAPRKPPKKRDSDLWLRSGVYEALARAGKLAGGDEGGTEVGGRAGAFADGDDYVAAVTGSSAAAKENSRWWKDIAENHTRPMLLPLTQDGVFDDEPEGDVWALRWLVDGRARRDLWFAFGRSMRHFRWTCVRGTERRPQGFGVFTDDAWLPGLRPTAERDFVGCEVVWRRETEEGAAPPEPGVAPRD